MSRWSVASARVEIVRARLRRPFVTALGERLFTENAALTLRLAGGAVGYGEASTSLAMKSLTAAALTRALRALAALARGRDARDWRALSERAWRRFPDLGPAVAAFESALLSALAREAGLPLAHFFGGAARSLETDLTISASRDPALAAEAAAEAARAGFTTLKVKVGGAAADDLARVRAVAAAAPGARLILDGNQGLTPRGALELLERAARLGAKVVLLEQPVRKDDERGLLFVARRSPVPVAADESAATPAQAARLLDSGAATAVNVKLAKSGVARGLEICALARAAGVPLMIGCMAETAPGLSSSVHLALGTGFFRFVDLDSDVLLVQDPAARLRAGWTRRGRFVEAAPARA